jgi:hypothetical protein
MQRNESNDRIHTVTAGTFDRLVLKGEGPTSEKTTDVPFSEQTIAPYRIHLNQRLV